MKQVVFKIVAPGVPILDVICGEVKDGQFLPAPDAKVWLDSNGMDSSVIEPSQLLGTQAFIRMSDVVSFIKLNVDVLCRVEIHPNLTIFTLKSDDYEESKES